MRKQLLEWVEKIQKLLREWWDDHFSVPQDTSIGYIDGDEEFRDELKKRR